MRDRSTKHCENCRSAILAFGLPRPILICNNKSGCEKKFFVIEPKDVCANFRLSRNIPKPPLPDSEDAEYIPLTQGKFVIVDAEDYDWLNQYKWYCQRCDNRYYALRRQPGCEKKISMHREIMNAPKGLFVDHIDGNGLNNRRNNLRLCSPAQNALNRRPVRNCLSKYKGVTWHKAVSKWYVTIQKSGKKTYLGVFDNEIEAAKAYDKKAKELFGEFAYLNLPEFTAENTETAERI